MNIVFINGCLEPKKDGVGDYIYRLGTACQEQGHKISAIAINDHAIQKSGTINNHPFPTLRLKNIFHSQLEYQQFNQFISHQNPDVISLQFVCYSFHPKGLCYRVYPFFKKLPHVLRHIMAHELWIGPHDNAPLKEKCIGWLQKQCIIPIFKKADCIHTQSPLYQNILKQLNIKAKLLPLFSNLPIANGNPSETLTKTLSKQNNNPKTIDFNTSLIFGFFGSFYRGFNPQPIWNFLNQISNIHKKNIFVISFGHLGSSMPTWVLFKKQAPLTIPCLELSNLDDHTLSLCLQAIDFGLATTPQSLIHKSGSANVLHSHGIPTIICRNDVNFKRSPDHFDTTPYIPFTENLAQDLLNYTQYSPQDTVHTIAKTFISDLFHA